MDVQKEQERLEQIAEFVEKRLRTLASERSEENFDPDYRWEHTLRVTSYGQKIAEEEGAKVELVLAACLLHDVAYFDYVDIKNHGRLGARLSRPFLKGLGYKPSQVETICHAVASHVDGKGESNQAPTLESRVVTDADAIDSVGPYGIYLWMEAELYEAGGFLQIEQKLKEEIQRLEQYAQQLPLETETGRELFAHHVKQQLSFYRALVQEHERTTMPSL